MKITKHTSNTLTVRDCPGGTLFAGLFILAVAGAALAGIIDSYTTSQNKVNEFSTALILLFSLMGFAVGGCIIIDHRFIYIKFNKGLNTALVHRIGILKIETISYHLDEIEDIIITKSKDRGFYRVVLKLKDNRRIPISGARWANDVCLKKSSDAAREFLNTKAWQFSHSRIYELMNLSCRAIQENPRIMHCH